MVAHFTMRTHGVYQAFRFVDGIWLHRKSHQVRFIFFGKRPCLHHTCTTWNEQPSNIKTMPQWALKSLKGQQKLRTSKLYKALLIKHFVLYRISFCITDININFQSNFVLCFLHLNNYFRSNIVLYSVINRNYDFFSTDF